MKMGMRNLIKIFGGLLTVLTLIIANPTLANAAWKQDGTGWWYTEGNSYATGWRIIDGKWYYFHTNGYMAHDCWIGEYYINSNGIWATDNNGINKENLKNNYNQNSNKVSTINNSNYSNVYNEIIKMKSKYQEGMSWNNDNFYTWNGGIYGGGNGCAGFAFLLSDAAFGKLPARKHTDFNNIKVGDILRINNDTHSVVALEIKSDSVIVAEGNYNSSVHWGREISLSDIKSSGTYILTRYPQDN